MELGRILVKVLALKMAWGKTLPPSTNRFPLTNSQGQPPRSGSKFYNRFADRRAKSSEMGHKSAVLTFQQLLVNAYRSLANNIPVVALPRIVLNFLAASAQVPVQIACEVPFDCLRQVGWVLRLK